MLNLYNRYVFPHLLDRIMHADSLMQARAELLAPVAGDVLEIGFGTGTNLPFYTAQITTLTTIDPNADIGKMAASRVAKASFPVHHITLSAETLPLESNRFDAVVSTFTLCSIANVAQALAEIKRVLKPNGTFHFVEHGLSPKPNLAKWQHRLTPLQKTFADGCHLNRNIKQLIEDAGFTFQEVKHFEAAKLPAIGAYMTFGRANKA